MTRAWTGIGSRETPGWCAPVFAKIGARATELELELWSGGAPGADTMAEDGHPGAKAIFLPWRGFNGNPSPLFPPSDEAYRIAAKFHRSWASLSSAEMALMARNTHQVLGRDCRTPSLVVVCWTRGAREVGGTAQAMRIARYYEVPIVNLESYGPLGWSTVAGMSTGRKRRAAQRKANRWAKVEVRRKNKAMSAPPFQVGELWVTAAQIVEAAGMAPPLFVE